MKKSILFIACCIGLMFFASCKKGGPTITVATDPEYVSPNAEVYSNSPITVGFNVSGENLVQITVIAEQNGAAIGTYSEPLDNVSNYFYAKTLILDAIGTVTIRGTVTDATGKTASKSFDIHFNEKPNAKFIGHYEGDFLVSGNINAEITGMEPVNETLENYAVAAIVDITDGGNINEVSAAITINEQTSTVPGTVNGNKVTFEAANSVFTFNYYYEPMGLTIPISLNMTYTINGLLNGNQLDLDGTCSGNGDNMFGTIELVNGTIDGSLNKTR